MADSSNIFRILVATDNHLGFAEKDTERGNDSFNTFKEILELAEAQHADFILLGGDLFHENKPSRQCLVKCMELLKAHTFGDKPVEFDLVSDPAENFPQLKNPVVNFHDPNLNVSIPVFSIHGNHDDPAGLGHLCALDMLSTTGLINYFGRTNNLKDVTVSPLLLVKGTAKLALYGLSAIKDERLFRLFKEGMVKMLRPNECTDEWYNVMVLHQNHTERPPTNYIPEEFLDSFLDMVIWGHEHECKVQPRESSNQPFFVMQPGSSVATSLCEGEAVKKQVALLEVNNERQIKVTPLPLQTVRPMVFKNVSLTNLIGAEKFQRSKGKSKEREEHVEAQLEAVVREMIETAKLQLSGHPRQPILPLLRLRVEYLDEEDLFNVVRFGHRFAEEVANNDEILLFRKTRKSEKKGGNDASAVDMGAMDAVFGEDITGSRVEDLVQQYFLEMDADSVQQMQVLTERGLANAVTRYVDKDDKDAISAIFDHQVQKTVKYLEGIVEVTEDTVEAFVSQYRNQRLARLDHNKDDQAEAEAVLNAPTRVWTNGAAANGEENEDSDGGGGHCSDDSNSEVLPPARGRGSRGVRGSRGGRGSRGPRGARGRGANPLDFTSNGDSSRSFSSRSTPAKEPVKSSLPSQSSSRSSGVRKGAVFDSDSD